ncbi:MAG: phosphatidylserine decarboxylase [Hyphomicrobiales bacterium]
MSKPLPLRVWDRQRGRSFEEFMEDRPATYESRPHRSFNQWLESHPLYDWLLAAYQNTRRSARQIEPFIRKHGIDMSEFKPVAYQSFAEFFDREFKEGARTFPVEPYVMGAFAEARCFGWEKISSDQCLPVKGHSLRAEDILNDPERARAFAGGPVLLARLSPTDYHHVHYFDDGETVGDYRLGHRLWTVNWRALQNDPRILCRNERLVSILKTRHFGTVAFVEVGALSVGRIVQVHPTDRPFARGAEKSAFRFGGSAILVFGEPGAWLPAQDILEHTRQDTETLVRLGDLVAQGAAP